MGELQNESKLYTPQEYIELLDSSDEKWEYFDGEVYLWEAMAGTSDGHSKICSNLHRLLGNQFIKDGSKCSSLDSDALLHLASRNSYRFPDVTVQCGPPEYDEQTGRARKNPTVLFEVVSASSRQSDYTVKLHQYSKLTSLREYVVIEQSHPMVTVFSRDHAEDNWTTIIYFVKGTVIPLASINVGLAIEEVYRDLVFEAKSSRLVPGGGIPEWPAAARVDDDKASSEA